MRLPKKVYTLINLYEVLEVFVLSIEIQGELVVKATGDFNREQGLCLQKLIETALVEGGDAEQSQ